MNSESFKEHQAHYDAIIEALRDLVYRNDIMLKYIKDGRLELRWTAKDKIAEAGELANSEALEISLKHAKLFLTNPVPVPVDWVEG